MKIIKASYEIQPKQEEIGLFRAIENAGRLCYKSEEKQTEESAIPFVLNCWKAGHRSVLDMGHAVLRTCLSLDPSHSRFLNITQESDRWKTVSGSVRAFLELPDVSASLRCLKRTVAYRYPVFGAVVEKSQSTYFCESEHPRHIYRSVKFIVNRAVSHELVRHRPMGILQESQRYCRYSEDKFGNEVTFIAPSVFFDGADPLNPSWYIWEKAMISAERDYLKLLELGASPQAARTVLPNSCKTELIIHTSLEHWSHIFFLRTSKAAEPSMREVMIPLLEDFRRLYPEVFYKPKRMENKP